MATGVVAGVIDIVPMIIQKLDRRTTVSAFLHNFFACVRRRILHAYANTD